MARQTTASRSHATRRSSSSSSTRRRAAPRSARSTRRGARPRTEGPGRTPPARRADAAEERGIQRFLETFTAALTSGDGRAAAQCFEYPSLMVMSAVGGSGGNQPIESEGSAAAFFGRAPEQYHAQGIEETFPDVEDVQWISHDLALVKVHFPYIDGDGNDLGDGETSLYVLRKAGDDDYRICAAVTLGTDGDRASLRGDPAL